MKNREILISVIIPVYNAESTLCRCLDSVCNQSLENIEIICVDDCSTDHSSHILMEYATRDGRVVIISHKINKRAGGARNTGISIAKGHYIVLLDSDDEFASNMALEKLYGLSRNGEADIVRTNLVVRHGLTSEEDIIVHLTPSCTQEECIKNALKEGFPMVGCLVKKSIFTTNCLMYPENVYYEDNPIHFLLPFLCNDIVYTDLNEYIYHGNVNSITATNSYQKMKDRIYTTELLLQYIVEWNCYTQYKDFVDDRLVKLHLHTFYCLIPMSIGEALPLLLALRDKMCPLLSKYEKEKLSKRDKWIINHLFWGYIYCKRILPIKRKLIGIWRKIKNR